jgi:hypothetical protein
MPGRIRLYLFANGRLVLEKKSGIQPGSGQLRRYSAYSSRGAP